MTRENMTYEEEYDWMLNPDEETIQRAKDAAEDESPYGDLPGWVGTVLLKVIERLEAKEKEESGLDPRAFMTEEEMKNVEPIFKEEDA